MNNFRINDILFDVPPTDISISHRSTVFENSYLRSKYATKTKTGKTVAYIQLRLIVLPDNMWKLHRLIQQFRYTPFWDIENDYVRTSLFPGSGNEIQMAVCAESMNIGSIIDSPKSHQVDLVLVLFNYSPYGTGFLYKQDWLFDTRTKRTTLYDTSIDKTFLNPTPANFPVYEQDPGELLQKSQYIEYNDLTPPSVKHIPTHGVSAIQSNVYKLFCNRLQAEAMETSFYRFNAIQDVLDLAAINIGQIDPFDYPFGNYDIIKQIKFKWNEYRTLNQSSNVSRIMHSLFKDFEDADLGPDLDNANLIGDLASPTGKKWTNLGTPLSVTGGIGRVTSIPGYRASTPSGGSSNHKGTDIGWGNTEHAGQGIRLYSMIQGEVVMAVRQSTSAGCFIVIKGTGDHDGLFTVHMHMASADLPSIGSRFNVGSSIGSAGTSSLDRGKGKNSVHPVHAHVELWEGGSPYGHGSQNPILLNPNEVSPSLREEFEVIVNQNSAQASTPIDQNVLAGARREIQHLEQEGWRFLRSPHTAPVLYRSKELRVWSEGRPEEGLVSTAWGLELYNSFSYLPLIGHEYPTAQYMGGQDAKLYFQVANLSNKKPSGLDSMGEALMDMRRTLEFNSRNFKTIQDSWTCNIECLGARLASSKTWVLNTLNTNTSPNNPGLYQFVLEFDASAPFVSTGIERQGIEKEQAYRELLKLLEPKIAGSTRSEGRWQGNPLIATFDSNDSTSSEPLEVERVIRGEKIRRPYTPQTNSVLFPGAHIISDPNVTNQPVWDVTYKNSSTGDDWEKSVIDRVVRLLYVTSYSLSDKFYGGYTPKELESKANLWGIEQGILPNFEGKGLDQVQWYKRPFNAVSDFGLDTGLASLDDADNAHKLLRELTREKNSEVDHTQLRRAAEGVASFGSSAATNTYANMTSITNIEGEAVSGFTTTPEKEDVIINQLRQQWSLLFDEILDEAEQRNRPEYKDILDMLRRSAISNVPNCYPDLALPEHPMLGDDIFTPPDFYFYNSSEDANIDILDDSTPWKDQLKTCVNNSWDSLQEFANDKKQKLFSNTTSNFESMKNLDGSDFQKNYRSQTHNLTDEQKEWLEIEKDFVDPVSGRKAMKDYPGLFGPKDENIDMVFGKAAVEQLAIESSKDLTNHQTFIFRRAFPAFKLYFFDEDENNKGWRSFSDFYGYSAIKNITVTRSRKIPADVVIIEMQNVAGVLDGTLTGSTKDIDYANREYGNDGKLTKESSLLEQNLNQDKAGTVEDTYFESLVLREGMNVQLRLGNSNNPDYLETVFNGRIIQVDWTDNNEMVSIMCQSYAVELINIVKGITGKKLDGKDATDNKTLSFSIGYKDTTELLSEMIKSPEVLHFGRWNMGNIFQYGEASTPTIVGDNPKYTKSTSLWNMKMLLFGDTSNAMKDIYAEDTPTVDPKEGDVVANRTFSNGLLGHVPVIGELDQKILDFVGSPFKTAFSFMPKKVKAYTYYKYRELRNNPVDDNIFAPHPQDFIDYGWTDTSGSVSEQDAKYYPVNTTIWEIFQEMCLRHPGWVSMAVPYGKRMTMFFGVPSQRYWSQDISKGFVTRMRFLRDSISNELKGTGPVSKDLAGWISEYTTGLNIRFRPFRRYHLATSKHNIVANNISVSGYGVHNAVSVLFTKSAKSDNDTDDRIEKNTIGDSWKDTYELKVHSELPDELVTMDQIEHFNCNGKALAERYAIASLMSGLKDMYKGSITLLGNPRIKPHDIIFLADEYNGIAGPVEVEEVTHILSHEHGFISIVVPDAVTIANETSSFPILNALSQTVVLPLLGRTMASSFVYGSSPLLPPTTGGVVPGVLGANAAVNNQTQQQQTAIVGSAIDLYGAYQNIQAPGIAETLFNVVNFYLWMKSRLAVNVVPLMHNGKPMVAGIPEDMFDISWDNFKGKGIATLNNIAKGRMKILMDAMVGGYRINNSYDGDLNFIEQMIIGNGE